MAVGRSEDLLQLLTRAERLSARRTQRALEEFGCSVEGWRVLALLSDGQGHNMTRNLVHRRTDPVDRRRILARLTERGQRFWQEVDERVRAEWATLPVQEDAEQLHTLPARLSQALADGVTPGRTAPGAGRGR
jgi:hypothetical protein